MLRKVFLLTALALGIGAGGAHAQTRVVTGRITDATTGEPVSGAQVSVALTGGAVDIEGTNPLRAVTGNDGTFTLEEVPAGENTLVVQRVGYQRTDVTVPAGQNSVQVALAADVLGLDEIVVTGQATGIQRRNLANAVSTVSAEQLDRVPAASVETQLAAKVPGADVQSNSGAPGGGNQINLRGVSTIIGNSTPLYVVDGVIVSDETIQSGTNAITRAGAAGSISSNQDNAANRIADLNPADIATIEVLKGGSSAAIYGSKANNGVIIITTKRGRAGAPQYTVTQRVGVSQLARTLGRRTFTDSATAVDAFGSSAAPYFAGGQIPQTYDLEEQLAGGNPLSTETALSVRGGTENTRYYVSGLVKNDNGIITNTGYDKYSLRLNLDQTVSDRISLALQTNAIRTSTDRGFTGNDNTNATYYLAFAATPSFVDLARDASGNFQLNPFTQSNPLQTAALAINNEEVNRFTGALTMNYDALRSGANGLRFAMTGGADVFSLKSVVYASEELQIEAPAGTRDAFPGTSALSNSVNQNYNVNLSAIHTFQPANRPVSATTSIGTRYEYRDLDIARNLTRDLFAGQQNVGEGTINDLAQTRSRTKDLSFFVQEELLLGERLLLTGGLNLDRSSNNTDTDEYFLYPKVASSYRVPLRSPVVDELKVRAAYGEAGNQPVYGDKFNELAVQSIAGVQALRLSSTTVVALEPERQKEIEGGVDAVLFGGRASLNLTAYRRQIENLLLNRDLAPSTGYTTAIFNSDGLLTTRGFEAGLTAVPVQARGYDWTSRIAFSLDRSVIDSLPVPAFNASNVGFGTSLGTVRVEQGKSPTQIIGRDTTTFVDDPRCLEALGAEAGSGACPAGIRIITQIGDANPDFRVGFSNDIRYKALSLASTVDWQHGGDVINLFGFLLDANRNTADFDDPCTGPNCRPGETTGEQRLRVYPSRTTTTWIEDASFVKLREVALGFDVPPAFLERGVLRGIESMRLSLSGRNLLTFTDYSGFDPEVNNFGSQPIRSNIDVGPYPPSRSYYLSVDLGF